MRYADAPSLPVLGPAALRNRWQSIHSPAVTSGTRKRGRAGASRPHKVVYELPGTMVSMALRSPIYLDIETLLSHAEYHDIQVPRQAEIVEKSTRKRSGGGKVGLSGLGVDASVGRDVEYQSTYTLAPREKATVSKVIDSLIAEEAVKVDPGEDTPLSKDDLVEVDGTTRITAASIAGKMFYALRRVMAGAEDLDTMLNLDADDPQVLEQLKRVYLDNELLPIPVLEHNRHPATPAGVHQRRCQQLPRRRVSEPS